MKLSKQERIAVIFVIILIILVVGILLYIKPNIETIIETKATLTNKEKEYNDAVAKAATKDELKKQVLEAYDKGKNLADMFFSELTAYEADNEFREFLATCKANVLVEDLEVSAPATAGISTSVFVPADVQYALKDYVNQGKAETADPGLIRQALIQLSLGEPQTIGATTVTFTLKATTIDDILLFADEVNRYQKDSVRKSIELDNIDFTDNKTTDEYQALADSILKQAEAAAAKVFKEKTGQNLSGHVDDNNTATATPPGGENNNNPGSNADKTENLNHYYYEMPCTITFYSIERMQNPSKTLDAQDAAITDDTAA